MNWPIYLKPFHVRRPQEWFYFLTFVVPQTRFLFKVWSLSKVSLNGKAFHSRLFLCIFPLSINQHIFNPSAETSLAFDFEFLTFPSIFYVHFLTNASLFIIDVHRCTTTASFARVVISTRCTTSWLIWIEVFLIVCNLKGTQMLLFVPREPSVLKIHEGVRLEEEAH